MGWGRVGTQDRHSAGLNARGKGVKELRERQDPRGENVGRPRKRARQVNIFLAHFQVKTKEAAPLKKGKNKMRPYLSQMQSNGGTCFQSGYDLHRASYLKSIHFEQKQLGAILAKQPQMLTIPSQDQVSPSA